MPALLLYIFPRRGHLVLALCHRKVAHFATGKLLDSFSDFVSVGRGVGWRGEGVIVEVPVGIHLG